MKHNRVLFRLVLAQCCSFFAITHASKEYVSAHRQMEEHNAVDFSAVDFDASDVSEQVISTMVPNLKSRLEAIYERTKTPQCRAEIAQHFGYYLQAIAKESSLPYDEVEFHNTCPEPVYDLDNLPEGMHLGHIQNRTYQPENGTYIEDPADLVLLYGILTHKDPDATIRLIESLYTEGTTLFVIHVDAKSDETQEALKLYALDKSHVFVLDDPSRCRVNWGGFSMVNATIQILQFVFGLLPNSQALDFHKFIHMASTSYPIASNARIRQTLAQYPLDANHLHVIMKPTRPSPNGWHYFVECDDWVHRIYRLKPLNRYSSGVELYTASQWFVLSREFAHYIAKVQPGTLVYDLLEYAQHVVVADETFFGTLLRNTEYCTKHHNWNFLHLQFDRWEQETKGVERDERKCIMPDSNHCGRSPTTMTMDYAAIMELSGDLFARKFDDSVDPNIKNTIDRWRQQEEEAILSPSTCTDDSNNEKGSSVDTSFAGHGVMIVAKATVRHANPLCLGLGPTRNKARIVPCFHNWVVPTLAEDWETGAVVEDEVVENSRWQIGPCSSDGSLYRNFSSSEMISIAGNESKTPISCMVTQLDGIRAGRCLDFDSNIQSRPGGTTQVYPCAKLWHQFVSFGGADTSVAPKNSIYSAVPRHLVERLRDTGYPDQSYGLCLGVRGRGSADETEWVTDDAVEREDLVPETFNDNFDPNDLLHSLSNWKGMQVVATQCSNTGAVLEWVFVPFILEEEEPMEPEEFEAHLQNVLEGNDL